jgi:hypothetical protein
MSDTVWLLPAGRRSDRGGAPPCPAICRGPPVDWCMRCVRTTESPGFATAARQIAGQATLLRLRQNQKPPPRFARKACRSCQAQHCFCPQGVGAIGVALHLARDLPGTASRLVHAVCQDNRVARFCYRCAADRGTSHAPTPSAESKASTPFCPEVVQVMPGTALPLPAGRRSVACPAICRGPAAKPVHAGCLVEARFCPQGVGARLPAICRKPAVKPVHAVYQHNRVA